MNHVLLVGYHPSIGRLLAAPATSHPEQVHLMEEPSLFEPTLPFLHLDEPELGGIVEVRTARYQQRDEYSALVSSWADDISFDAVMPGREYGVQASGAIARMLDLPHPGKTAIEACTNKLKLRSVCGEFGIPQPAFSPVRSADDLREFVRANGSGVVKPANRHAALGVSKVEDAGEVEAAWLRTTSDPGPDAVSDRDLQWDYLAEEWLDGQQVSVESLVSQGTTVFHNVTWVELDPGLDFVEAACIVPAPLPESDYGAIIDAQEALLGAIQARVGLFHSEWKLTESGPRLLECAARVPGGLLPEQIWWAWDFNICLAFSQVLQGRKLAPRPPSSPRRACLIRFLYAEAGEVKSIEGLGVVRSTPQIADFKCVSVGERVDATRNPWNYSARFVLVGDSVQEVQDLRARIDGEFRVVTTG